MIFCKPIRFLTVFRMFFCFLLLSGPYYTVLPVQDEASLSPRQIKKKISQIGKKIDSLSYLREVTIKDSIQIAAKNESERMQLSAEIQRISGLIKKKDSLIAQTAQIKSENKSANKQKIIELNKKIQLLLSQKKRSDDRLARAESRGNAITEERKRLVQSSKASENRYERIRTPYEEAVKNAETELLHVKGERQLLLALKNKLLIDRMVYAVRDSLDKAIQLATRKRKARKLVEKWEDVLDSLNSTQDSLIRGYSGIRRREATITGLNLSQKIASVDSAIVKAEKKIPSAKAPYEKARRNLLAFERKNPPPKSPSRSRLSTLDTSIVSQKKAIFIMADASDSLGMLIEESRNTIKALSSAAPDDRDDLDSWLQQSRKERTALEQERDTIVRDSVRRHADHEIALTRITNNLTSFNSQLVILQDDLSRFRNADESSRPSQKAEPGTLPDYGDQTLDKDDAYDDLKANAEQELALLLEEREKVLSDIDRANKVIRDGRKALKRKEKSIDKKIKEIARLNKKSKTDDRTMSAQSKGPPKGTEIAQKRLEEIYVLIGNNKMGAAVQLFRQMRPFLKAKLDPEAFQTLKMTLVQMGAVLQ